MAAGRKPRERYDGVTPFYANGKTGVVLYDLIDERGRPYQMLPASATPREEKPVMAGSMSHPRLSS